MRSTNACYLCTPVTAGAFFTKCALPQPKETSTSRARRFQDAAPVARVGVRAQTLIRYTAGCAGRRAAGSSMSPEPKQEKLGNQGKASATA